MYEFDWSSIPGALPFSGKGMKITWSRSPSRPSSSASSGAPAGHDAAVPNKPLSWFAAGYVNLFRSVPLVMVCCGSS
jgi:glutamate/aspartate transport system permease protein